MNRKIVLRSLSIVASLSLVAGATFAFFSDSETSEDNTFTAGSIDLLVGNTSYYNGAVSAATTWSLRDVTVEKFFDFNDVKPADFGEDTIGLQVLDNDAWACADVTLTSDNDNDLTEPESDANDTTAGVGEGELADAINFVWWADDGDNVLEDNETALPGGPLGALGVGETATVTLADSTNNLWSPGPDTPLVGAATVHLGKAWCFGTIGTSPLPQTAFTGPNADNNGDTVVNSLDGGITCAGATEGDVTQTDSLTADVSFRVIQARSNDDFVCAPEEI